MPFKKGYSGNPAGRPTKHKLFREALVYLLRQPLVGNRIGLPKKPTIEQVMARNLIMKAIRGHIPSLKLIFNIVDGKVEPAVPDYFDDPPIQTKPEPKMSDRERALHIKELFLLAEREAAVIVEDK